MGVPGRLGFKMGPLPLIALRSVLLHVRHHGQGRVADLLTCALVNRAWHDAAMPILCGIISLDLDRVKEFTRVFAVERRGRYVRSLTLRIQGDTALSRDPSNGKAPHPDLRALVQRLVPMLKDMGNLACFSVVAAPTGICFFSRQDLGALLSSLSPACTHLEIDTRETDICTLDGQRRGKGHICPSIRRLLPQLVQLRLRTRTMCPAIFHKGVDDQDPLRVQPESLSEHGFMRMPAIRSLVVDCGRTHVGNHRRCGADMIAAYRADPNMSAWSCITQTMQRMVEVASSMQKDVLDTPSGRDSDPRSWLLDPDKVRILAIGHTEHDNHNDKLWAAVVRADMLKEESWAIPIRQIWPSDVPGSWLVRLPDGREVMGSSAHLQTLAADENEGWLDLWDGSRLPRRVIAAHEDAGQGQIVPKLAELADLCGGLRGVRPPIPSLKSREEWQFENPRKSAMHWKKEDKCGQRVVGAERRVGRDDYTSLRLIQEVAIEVD